MTVVGAGDDPFGSAAIRVSLWWVVGAAVVVAVPFCVVGVLISWDSAFNIVTGSLSPFQPGLGPWGWILAFVGYLLVPAAVGAIASLWFTRNIQRTYGGALLAASNKQLAADLGTGTPEQRAVAAAKRLNDAASDAAKTVADSLEQAKTVAESLEKAKTAAAALKSAGG